MSYQLIEKQVIYTGKMLGSQLDDAIGSIDIVGDAGDHQAQGCQTVGLDQFGHDLLTLFLDLQLHGLDEFLLQAAILDFTPFQRSRKPVDRLRRGRGIDE